MMNDNSSLIVVDDVKKYYNDGEIKALDGVSTDIRKGEVVVIIGPSGSGKSTLLRTLNLLEHPTDGKIIFDGVNLMDKNVNIGSSYRPPPSCGSRRPRRRTTSCG